MVLDEVHPYRGSLGANIGLLYRRLMAHWRQARQDWKVDERRDNRRFPETLPVATSATIKSIDETGRTPAEVKALRDEVVQEFLGKLTGVLSDRFRVLGEELRDLQIPELARWTPEPAVPQFQTPLAEAGLRSGLATLSGGSPDQPLGQSPEVRGPPWIARSWARKSSSARSQQSWSSSTRKPRAACSSRGSTVSYTWT